MARSAGGVAVTVTLTSTTGIFLFQSNHGVIRDGLQSGITSPGDGEPAKAVRVNTATGSAVAVQFRVKDIHGMASTASWVVVPAGEYREFVAFDGAGGRMGGIHALEARVDTAGTGTYSFEVTAS